MQNLKQRIQVYWNIRWLRRLVISVAIIAGILILIPVGIQFAIGYILKDQGADQASVDDINLNLFAGSFELSGLNMKVAGSEPASLGHLYANLNMLELVKSRIVVDEISMQGMNIQVNRDSEGNISVNGLKVYANQSGTTNSKPEPTKTSEPLAFAINRLSISQIALNYQEPDFQQQLKLSDLKLTNLKSWQPDSTANLQLTMALNQSPVKLSADLNLFDSTRKFKGDVSIQSVAFTPYSKFYRDYLKSLQGQISITTDFDLALNDQIHGEINNDIEIKNLDLEYQRIHQQNELIHWQGKTTLNANLPSNIEGKLALKNSKTSDTEQKYEMASFSSLDLEDIHYQPQSIKLGNIDLQNLIVVNQNEKQQFLNLAQLLVEKLDVQQAEQAIDIQQITLKDPVIQVTLDKDKKPQQLQPLLATLDALTAKAESTVPDAPSPAAATEPSKPFKLHIAQLKLDQPGKIEFADLSVSPNYATTLHLNQINIENISSTEAATFTLALKQGDYTTFDIKGSGLLLDPTDQINLKANIKQLDLPPVTAYTSAAMGYGMKSGVVDSDLDIKINKRIIDSMVDLKIDSIEVVETQPKTAEQVTSASGMSIDLAVSTLKDDNNMIDLKLPVKGSLDQPDFDLSLVINKALGKAMQSASLSYLKYALQPFGSLVSLFKLAKAAADHISLPPILFKTNSLALEDQQQELIEKVIKVMKERPELKIKACGISSLADQEAIKEELINQEKEKLKEEQDSPDKVKKAQSETEIVINPEDILQRMKKLADNRAAKVKAQFVGQGSVKPSRILNCLSSTEPEKGTPASVELQI
jgi:hypothetical protein